MSLDNLLVVRGGEDCYIFFVMYDFVVFWFYFMILYYVF